MRELNSGSNFFTGDLSNDSKLDVWRKTIELWDCEANRFWVRSNIFLLSNGVLVSFISTNISKCYTVFLGSIIGILLSIIWYKVNRKGKWYIDRWRSIIIGIENEIGIDIFKFIRRSKDPYKNEQSTTSYMRYGILIFITSYFILLIIGLYQINDIRLKSKNVIDALFSIECDTLNEKCVRDICYETRHTNHNNLTITVRLTEEQFFTKPVIKNNITNQLISSGYKKENIHFRLSDKIDTNTTKQTNQSDFVKIEICSNN